MTGRRRIRHQGVRAVEFLRDSGIRQFLDIGTGLPTSPAVVRADLRDVDTFLPPRGMHAVTAESARRGAHSSGAAKTPIARMFNGRELVDPGLVLISYWSPDGGQPARNADRVWGYCGVART